MLINAVWWITDKNRGGMEGSGSADAFRATFGIDGEAAGRIM
eukprot:COSAG06_NODE_56143_length_286_cov_0.818182_1_plen_41_part_10